MDLILRSSLWDAGDRSAPAIPCLTPSQEQARSPSLGHNHHFCRARAPREPAAPCSAPAGHSAAHGARPILLPHVGLGPCHWLCWSRRGLTEDLAPVNLLRVSLGSAGGRRGPPYKRAGLVSSVWQTALKLYCSSSGEFPSGAGRVAGGESCNTMPLALAAAGAINTPAPPSRHV